jgi:hypothetical protein
MVTWRVVRPRALAGMVLNIALVLLVAAQIAPQILGFAYRAQAGTWDIRSEQPISPAIAAVVARSDALLVASPINRPQQRLVYLTEGGWRWKLLTLTDSGAFGLTRPGIEAIIINRNDVTADRVTNGHAVGGRRSLSGTLAHEACHGLLRDRYGIIASLRMPTWQVEGYCDHVARETSLDDATARRLIAAGSNHPALIYWQGQRRMAVLLAEAGGDVDAVMRADNQLR